MCHCTSARLRAPARHCRHSRQLSRWSSRCWARRGSSHRYHHHLCLDLKSRQCHHPSTICQSCRLSRLLWRKLTRRLRHRKQTRNRILTRWPRDSSSSRRLRSEPINLYNERAFIHCRRHRSATACTTSPTAFQNQISIARSQKSRASSFC